jgi:hypothetical protein
MTSGRSPLDWRALGLAVALLATCCGDTTGEPVFRSGASGGSGGGGASGSGNAVAGSGQTGGRGGSVGSGGANAGSGGRAGSGGTDGAMACPSVRPPESGDCALTPQVCNYETERCGCYAEKWHCAPIIPDCPSSIPGEAAECYGLRGTQCLYREALCFCTERAEWACVLFGGLCPEEQPLEASSCEHWGMACEYEGSRCICEREAWRCGSPM